MTQLKREGKKMVSLRLTNENREDILNKLIHDTFSERDEKLEKERFDIAYKIYKKIYTPSTIKKIDALPKGWLKKSASMEIYIPGENYPINFSFGYQEKEKRTPIKKRFLDKEYSSYISTPSIQFTMEKNSEIIETIRTYLDNKETLNDERRKARNSASGTLYRITTLKSLLDNWPEIKPFIPQYILDKAQTSGTAVSLPREELNKIFDLPVEEREKKRA